MIRENEAIEMMTAYIGGLYFGKTPAGLPGPDEFPENMRALAQSLTLLGNSILEMNRFGGELSRGNLDAELPGRENYLTAPLKELQSQLLGLDWSIRQLLEGNPSSRSFAPGELYHNFNILSSKLRLGAEKTQDPAQQWSRAVNSWRYHQIISAMNQLHIMMLEVDRDGNVLYANPPFKRMFPELGRISYGDGEEPQGSALLNYLGSFSEHRPLLGADVVRTDRFPAQRELFDAAGDAWYKITTDRIKLVGGGYGLLHMIDDISEWKKHEHQLRKSASIDNLTGTYTRGVGLVTLNEAFEDRAVTKTCVAFIDVDGLKAVNDTYGHAEGDFTLRTIADIIMSCVRKSDWVIRFGGDEFVVIFKDCMPESADAAIARMYEKLDEANLALNKPYRLAFSIGCLPIEKHHRSVDELLSAVDELMYENKRKKSPPEGGARPDSGPYEK